MFIVEKNLAPLVGTDLHHHNHLAAIRNEKNRAIFESYIGNKVFNDLESLVITL